MMNVGMTELLVVLMIAFVLFGTKKVRNLGSDLGAAIKDFKTALSDSDKKESVSPEKNTVTSEQEETEAKRIS